MSVTQNYTRSATMLAEESSNNNNNSIILHDGIDYNLNNRTLVPIDIESDIVVAGDNNSQKIKFLVDRFFDGQDLTTKSIQIAFEDAEGGTNTTTIEKTSDNFRYDDNKITFIWSVDSRLTRYEGKVRFQVRFLTVSLDSEGRQFYSYLWQTKIQTFTVLPQIIIENDALPVNYEKEIELIRETASQPYFSIVDEDVPIDIVNREIGSLPQEIVVRGDSNSQMITFKLPRKIEGVEVKTKVIAIKYVNANGDGDRSVAINVEDHYEEGYISFGWLLSSKATAATGKLQFAIEVLGFIKEPEDPTWEEKTEEEIKNMTEEERQAYEQMRLDYEYRKMNNIYIWQTKTSVINVLNGIEISDYITEVNRDWFTNWTVTSEAKLKTMQNQVNSAEGFKNQAETQAIASDNARKASEDARNKSIEAQGLSEDARDKSIEAKNDSIVAQGLSEDARDKSIEAKDASVTAQGLSEDARDESIEAKNQAVAAQSAANTFASNAQQSEIKAATSEANAKSWNDKAKENADSASGSANAAQEAQGKAETAQGKAETAQEKSESAQAASETAKNDAVDAKDAAKGTYDDTVGVYKDAVKIKTDMENRQTWFMLVEEF